MLDHQKCTANVLFGQVAECKKKDLCVLYTAKPTETTKWVPPAPDFKPASGCSRFAEN